MSDLVLPIQFGPSLQILRDSTQEGDKPFLAEVADMINIPDSTLYVPYEAAFVGDALTTIIYNACVNRACPIISLAEPMEEDPTTLAVTFIGTAIHTERTNRALAAVYLKLMQPGDSSPTIWWRNYGSEAAKRAHLEKIIRGVR